MDIIDKSQREYSYKEILHIIKKHSKLICLVCLSILFITTYFTLITKPIYKAESSIMISEDQSTMSMLDLGLDNERNYLKNEIQVLQSRTTSELAIQELLNSTHKNNLYLFETKKYKPVYYRSYLTLGLLDRFQKQRKVEDITDDEIYKITKKLMKSISVYNERNTDMLKISVKSTDPHEAAILANKVIDVYRKRDLEWVVGEMTHLKSFLNDQLSKKEQELDEIEEKFKNFQEKEKIFTLDENSTILLNNLTDFETEYNNIMANIKITNERQKYIYSQLNSEERKLSEKISNSTSDKILAIKSEISSLEIDLISTLTQYGEEHSAVKTIIRKLEKLKSSIKDETKKLILEGSVVSDPILFRQSLIDSIISIKAVKANLESRANAFKVLVDEYDNKLSALPEKMLEFSRFERDRSILSETYSFMRAKLEEARIGEASQLGKIRVIDKAVPITKPITPNKTMNFLIALICGLFGGVLIAFLIEYLDNSIRTIEQIERRALSILAIIPAIGSEKRKRKTKRYLRKNLNIGNLQRRLITHEDPKSPISEAYRSLRTSLMYSSKNDNKCRTLLISSAGPGEGKTTTIANTAITYANLGKKTLLIDSDLRKPVLHDVFNLDKSPGLTSFLTGNSDLKEIVQTTNVDNLDVITAGVNPPNPSELLDSSVMDDFMEQIEKKYDIILFDTPPLIAVTDAYVMMKYVKQFVLVVRAGVTEKGALDRVLNVFNDSNFNISGVVMNAVSEEHSYGTGYYYNYYQEYYGVKD
tara:strand:- start:14546 stop:16825 length:2280 start_codon:yes stop_codon:yes gene_type:complete